MSPSQGGKLGTSAPYALETLSVPLEIRIPATQSSRRTAPKFLPTRSRIVQAHPLDVE